MMATRIIVFDGRDFCDDDDSVELCMMHFEECEDFNSKLFQRRLRQLIDEYKAEVEDWALSELVTDVMDTLSSEFPIGWEWPNVKHVEV
jgi:hypothetical protein